MKTKSQHQPDLCFLLLQKAVRRGLVYETTSTDGYARDSPVTSTSIPIDSDDISEGEHTTPSVSYPDAIVLSKPKQRLASPKKQRSCSKGKHRLSKKKRIRSPPHVDNPYERF